MLGVHRGLDVVAHLNPPAAHHGPAVRIRQRERRLPARGELLLPAGVPGPPRLQRRNLLLEGRGRRPLAGPPPARTDRRIDVLYCETSPPWTRSFADTVVSRLAAAAPTVRARRLPQTINMRSGYRAGGYEIRYDPSQPAGAREILALLSGLGGPDRGFRLVPVSRDTPGRLSVFLCP